MLLNGVSNMLTPNAQEIEEAREKRRYRRLPLT